MNEKNITLLLTIFNRPQFTKKWLNFANKEKIPFKIFICDGGGINLDPERIYKNYPNLDITYYKSKYYINYQFFWEKFYESLKQIKTEYTYLVEDDDYIISENILKSLEFLKNNKDYNSSGGIETHLEIVPGINKLLHIKPHVNTKGYHSTEVHHRIINSLESMYSNYNVLHRTCNLKKNFENLKKKNFKNLYITELIFVLTSLLQGKCNRFKHIEYIKRDNVEFSSSRNFVKKNKFSKIIKSKNFKEENNYFLKILEKQKITTQNNFQLIKNKLIEYLENDKKYRLNNEKQDEKIFQIKSILKKYLGKIYFFCKKNYIKFYEYKIIEKIVYSSSKHYKFNKIELDVLKKIYYDN